MRTHHQDLLPLLLLLTLLLLVRSHPVAVVMAGWQLHAVLFPLP